MMSEQPPLPGGNLSQQGSAPVTQTIDIEKLAEKVYQLMRTETRQARARGQKRDPRR